MIEKVEIKSDPLRDVGTAVLRAEIEKFRRTGEPYTSLSERLMAANQELSNTATCKGLADQMRRVAEGLPVRKGNYVFSRHRLSLMLAAFHALEPLDSPASYRETQRAKGVARRDWEFPDTAPDLVAQLGELRERCQAWEAGGVGAYRLSQMLTPLGFTSHYSKLSRLIQHGPVRPDRPETFILSRVKAAELEAALDALGEPPAPVRLPGAPPAENLTREQIDSSLSTEELARYFGCSVGTVCRLFRQGRLPGFRFGYQWRMSRDALQAFVDQGGHRAEDYRNA